jgi:archaellum biogenesis ATPase FlaH
MEEAKEQLTSNIDLLKLREAGARALAEYLALRPIQVGIAELDKVLEGGIEQGDFYLFIGASKSGKSTVLRNIGLTLAEKSPVLYLNFEQLGRNVFSALYKMRTGRAFRDDIQKDKDFVDDEIQCFPDIPFFMAFWADEVKSKSFNQEIVTNLKKSVDKIQQLTGERPVIIFENLSDVYNERIRGSDNVENVASQTIMDIKNFCKDNEVAMFLAHHTPKLGGQAPSVENGRDSNRIADLAHSIFACHVVEEEQMTPMGVEMTVKTHVLSYLRGRSSQDTKKWQVSLLDSGGFTLSPYEKKKTGKKPRKNYT